MMLSARKLLFTTTIREQAMRPFTRDEKAIAELIELTESRTIRWSLAAVGEIVCNDCDRRMTLLTDWDRIGFGHPGVNGDLLVWPQVLMLRSKRGRVLMNAIQHSMQLSLAERDQRELAR
jgi:hypothetical protein